nr:CTP synthase-like isoform X1 [Ipomoea batatas]
MLRALNLNGVAQEPDLKVWTSRAKLCDMLHEPVRVAMVGKYTGLSDSYLSVLKALLHASVACHRKLCIDWVPAGDLEEATEKESPDNYRNAWKLLKMLYSFLEDLVTEVWRVKYLLLSMLVKTKFLTLEYV